MQYLIYFALALGATIVGAATGMGGGVFMKPLMDMLGQYSVGTISMLSTLTVFCMALVSVVRQRGNEDKPERNIAVPLAIGAVVGGNLGSVMLSWLIGGMEGSVVTRLQNVILAILILFVMAYMRKKASIKSPELTGAAAAALVGLFLGICASFLGIGGGPINVALIILLFNYSTKRAAACSLITILFSQGARLVQTAVTTGFSGFDLSMAYVMILGAIGGGLLGAQLAKKLDEGKTDQLFQGAQVLILLICIVNIVRSMG